INSDVNSVEIPVLLQVTESGGENDGSNDNMGLTYVVLFDALTGENIVQTEVNATNGQYQYSLENVPSGTYVLTAGSDRDNDFFLCDSGESCGAWPTISQAGEITIDTQDRTDMDFNLSYPSALPDAAIANAKDTTSTQKALRIKKEVLVKGNTNEK